MAGEALGGGGNEIESFKPVPGDQGKFRIILNDELSAFHEHRPDAHLSPDVQDLMKAINERIDI